MNTCSDNFVNGYACNLVQQCVNKIFLPENIKSISPEMYVWNKNW